MRRVLLSLCLAVAGAWLISRANAGDFPTKGQTDPVCLVVGADAGSRANLVLEPSTQFMVRCEGYSGVRYRVCTSGGCDAGVSDALLDADKSIDLCNPSGYTQLSLYKLYDAGNPPCCVYRVNPRTVCPPP